MGRLVPDLLRTKKPHPPPSLPCLSEAAPKWLPPALPWSLSADVVDMVTPWKGKHVSLLLHPLEANRRIRVPCGRTAHIFWGVGIFQAHWSSVLDAKVIERKALARADHHPNAESIQLQSQARRGGSYRGIDHILLMRIHGGNIHRGLQVRWKQVSSVFHPKPGLRCYSDRHYPANTSRCV